MQTSKGDTLETLCGNNEAHKAFVIKRAHLNGRPVSKVLIDNGSVETIMPFTMLRALGKSINDLIETKVVLFA